jgi:sulfur-carrier protein
VGWSHFRDNYSKRPGTITSRFWTVKSLDTMLYASRISGYAVCGQQVSADSGVNNGNEVTIMAVKVVIPAQLRQFTEDQSAVSVEASTVGEVLDQLENKFPGVKERICESDGRIRRFVNVFVNGEDVRALNGVDTEVKDGDEVGIIPAVAGGQQA